MSLIATDKPTLDEQRYARVKRQNAALRDVVTLETVLQIKRAIGGEDECYAAQLWTELDSDTQRALYVAPSYGGIFTTKEREVLAKVGIQWQP